MLLLYFGDLFPMAKASFSPVHGAAGKGSKAKDGKDNSAEGVAEKSPAKVVLVGDAGAGKSALAAALVNDKFEPTNSTHGTQLWTMNDTGFIDAEGLLLDPGPAGHRLPRDVEQTEIAAAVVVVDPRSEHVEKEVCEWSVHLDRKRNPKRFKKLLARSRVDIGSSISDEDFVALARRHGFHSSFSTSAKDGVGIQELRGAISQAARSYGEDEPEPEDEVEVAVRTLAERLCELIANNSDALDRIEWRDLERVVATSLRGLGFTVELTPPAKDGGKDVVAHLKLGRERRMYYVEIKHWRSGSSPGPQEVKDFVEVNVRDNTHGGLFLSSSGFTVTVLTRVAEITRQRIRLGGRDKIMHLCQQFVRKRDGIWRVKGPLPDVLFANTIG